MPWRKRKLACRRVLITGASSGIGRALALALARQRVKLLITARRKHRLEQVVDEVEAAGGEALLVEGDVAEGDVRRRLVQAAQQHYGGLDILVNNAGMGAMGSFALADAQRLRRIMEVNFFSAADLIRQAMPLLRASEDAVIVNVGSVLGHCAVPKKSEYCASKFAMHGFTDALRMELTSENIDVLLVSPNTTDSEFFSRAMQSGEKVASNPWQMPAEEVARHIVRSIEYGRREVVLSVIGKLLVAADRLSPGWTSRVLARLG